MRIHLSCISYGGCKTLSYFSPPPVPDMFSPPAVVSVLHNFSTLFPFLPVLLTSNSNPICASAFEKNEKKALCVMEEISVFC